jgi:hypothetical protein
MLLMLLLDAALHLVYESPYRCQYPPSAARLVQIMATPVHEAFFNKPSAAAAREVVEPRRKDQPLWLVHHHSQQAMREFTPEQFTPT